jgi:hypothetical protein
VRVVAVYLALGFERSLLEPMILMVTLADLRAALLEARSAS